MCPSILVHGLNSEERNEARTTYISGAVKPQSLKHFAFDGWLFYVLQLLFICWFRRNHSCCAGKRCLRRALLRTCSWVGGLWSVPQGLGPSQSGSVSEPSLSFWDVYRSHRLWTSQIGDNLAKTRKKTSYTATDLESFALRTHTHHNCTTSSSQLKFLLCIIYLLFVTLLDICNKTTPFCKCYSQKKMLPVSGKNFRFLNENTEVKHVLKILL